MSTTSLNLKARLDLVARLGPLRRPSAKSVLWVLAYLADDDGEATPSKEELQRMTDLSESAVIIGIRTLQNEHGLIEVTNRTTDAGAKLTSSFRVRFDRLALPTASVLPQAGEPCAQAVGGPLAGNQLPVEPRARRGYSRLLGTDVLLYTIVIDDVPHVYRLTPTNWTYAGLSLDALLEHGAPAKTLGWLKKAGVASVNELATQVDQYQRQRQDDPELPFHVFLATNLGVLDTRNGHVSVVGLKEQGAQCVLQALQAWQAHHDAASTAGHAQTQAGSGDTDER